MRSLVLIGITFLLLAGVAQAETPYIEEYGFIGFWSFPAGGSIYIDGNYVGITHNNQTSFIILGGPHTVVITKPGYNNYSTSVYGSSGPGTIVTAYLTPTFTPASNPLELLDQTNWKLVIIALVLFLIGAVVLRVHKSKEGTHIEKLFPTKYAVAIGLVTVLILFLILYSVELEVLVFAIIIATGLVFGLDWIIRAFSITKGIVAIILISALALLLMWYFSFYESFVSGAIMGGIITGLVVGWVWILVQVIVWVIRAIAKAVRNRNYITKIGEVFKIKKLIKGELLKKPAHREKPVSLPIWIEYLQSEGIEKSIPEGKPSHKYKISWSILIILLIVVGAIGYTIYQKYSPLAELANCGNNCIDYKKVQMAQYETSVPDIKITNADADKLIMDVPIIIRNPSAKDTETVKIDFDVSMEGKHLTKGTIPAYELPAKQNTTILIKDVVIKYEELGEVLQKVAERHGAEVVTEGKANISMTTDLLIYFPIEVFSINIYTFTIPIQIESEVPVDMLKQNEEAKKQIEEKVSTAIKEVQEKIKDTLRAIPTKIIPSPTATLPQKTALPLPTPSNPQFP